MKACFILFVLIVPAFLIATPHYPNPPPLYLRNTIDWHFQQINHELEGLWGLTLTFPVEIEIRREYSVFTRAEALFDGSIFRIALPPTLRELPQLLRHEMMHLFTFEWIWREYDRTGRIIHVPLWIMEGLACWFESRQTQRIPRPLSWNETNLMAYEDYPQGDQVLVFYELVTDFFYALDQKIDFRVNLEQIILEYQSGGSWPEAFIPGSFREFFTNWRVRTMLVSWLRWLFVQSSWLFPAFIILVFGIIVWRRNRSIQDTFDPSLEQQFGVEYWKREKSWYNPSNKRANVRKAEVGLMKPFILGHRGFSELYPENSLLAFQKALEYGADGVELDVRMSKDNQIIVIHDATVDRVTGSYGRVSEMTLEELKTLSLAQNQKIPTLKEVLEEIVHRGLVNIELKEIETAQPVAALVKKFRAEEQVIFSSFIHDSLNEVRKIIPEARCGLLIGEEAQKKHGVSLQKPDTVMEYINQLCVLYRPYSLHLPIQALQSVDEVKRADLRQGFLALGIKIFWWTVDDVEWVLIMAKEHIAYGIITNHVEAIVKAFD